MGLFWRRKTGDEFVTLGLNEPKRKDVVDQAIPPSQKPTGGQTESQQTAAQKPAAIGPVGTGAGPTPIPAEPPHTEVVDARQQDRKASEAAATEPTRQKSVPARSPFATSVLGLNLSMEELQAQ